MNVLEKILEEIKQYTEDVYECDLDDIVEYQRRNREDNCTYIVQGIEEATEFIRSRMDEINTLKKKPVWEMDVMHHESYDLGRNIGWNECLEAMQQNTNDGWIPVEERLPEEKGWYQCTCSDKEIWNDDIVRDLYYYPEIKEFVDNIRYEANGLKNIEKFKNDSSVLQRLDDIKYNNIKQRRNRNVRRYKTAVANCS